jgi:MMPL family
MASAPRLQLRPRRVDRGLGAGLPLLGALRTLDGLPGLLVQERYQQTGSTAEGIVHGVASTARLITGAALIIIVVFIGFATAQLVSFQQMGFGVAVALLVDATVVRLVVIPAVMGLVGERNWYLPRWLGWLPRVQVETAAPAVSTGADRERPRRGLGVT